MSQVQSFTENRHEIDDLMLFLVLGARVVVCELVRPLVAQGSFSMADIPAESSGQIRTVNDIAQTMDLSALLAILMKCLSDTGPGLEIEGVSYALVDKVRRIYGMTMLMAGVIIPHLECPKISCISGLAEGLHGD